MTAPTPTPSAPAPTPAKTTIPTQRKAGGSSRTPGQQAGDNALGR